MKFFGRFKAYENISKDERAAYDAEIKKSKKPDKEIPLKARFKGLPEDI